MVQEWGIGGPPAASVLHADASAALGIVKRDGAGKLRHVNVQSLWLQEKVVKEELAVEKVPGEENPADGLTKHVKAELAQKYAVSIGLRLSDDRAKTSLRVAGGGDEQERK